jgi:hypothetical protein
MPLAEEAWRVFVRKDGLDEDENPIHPMIGYLAGFGVKFQAEEAVLKALDDTYLVVSSERIDQDVIFRKKLQAEQVVSD